MEPGTLAVAGISDTMYLDSNYFITKDLRRLWDLIKTFFKVKKAQREDKMHIYYRCKERAKEEPDRVFLIFGGTDFYQFLKERLPHYAVPLFIRIEELSSTTQTFKQQKLNLRNEGIDPSKIKQQICWVQNKPYAPFNKEDYARITRSDMKL